VFPLCGTAESFPEGSLSANFPTAIVPGDVRCGNVAGILRARAQVNYRFRFRFSSYKKTTPLAPIYDASGLIRQPKDRRAILRTFARSRDASEKYPALGKR